MTRSRVDVLRAATAGLLASAFIFLPPFPGDGPARQPRSLGGGPVRAALPPQAADGAEPFHPGERLEYNVSWQNLTTAATAQVQVTERRAFRRRVAWHFQARAHTVEPLRYLYPLDDQFDSYTDTQTLASLQYEIYLREAGKQSNAVIRMNHEGDPAEGEGPSVRVPVGTRDPLGAFYMLRVTDWRRTAEMRTSVYDGRDLYEVRARMLVEREEVRVPAGSYAATKVEVRVYERGTELPDALFWVWLAQNRAQAPVRIEAELPFGSLRVELTRGE